MKRWRPFRYQVDFSDGSKLLWDFHLVDVHTDACITLVSLLLVECLQFLIDVFGHVFEIVLQTCKNKVEFITKLKLINI
jgi:hypothetical protein